MTRNENKMLWDCIHALAHISTRHEIRSCADGTANEEMPKEERQALYGCVNVLMQILNQEARRAVTKSPETGTEGSRSAWIRPGEIPAFGDCASIFLPKEAEQ